MEKKSQPLLVIWVGMMLVIIICIGITGYLANIEPANQMSAQAPLNSNRAPLADGNAVALAAPDIPAGKIRSQQNAAAAPSDNTFSQLSDATNEITVSIYERGTDPGQAQFLGSGAIVTAESVLTGAHIVNSRSNLFVYVFAPRPASYPVALFRCDAANDLALLRVTNGAQFLSVGLLGNPNDLVAGDTVFAMGNANGNGNLLLDGAIIDKKFIVSANGQEQLRMRTDIAIPMGVCGGPLVNAMGEIIGISNSLGNPETATPINKALPLIYGKAQQQEPFPAPTPVV